MILHLAQGRSILKYSVVGEKLKLRRLRVVLKIQSQSSIVILAFTIGLSACQAQPPSPSTRSPVSGPTTTLTGAGATFPSFLYLRWFREYGRQNPTVRINYQPIGSAAGIQQFKAETIDFGGSDVTLTEADSAKVKRGAVFLPVTAGSIAVIYNLPTLKGSLKLSRQVLPEIFLGKIKRWNDPKIAALNPGATLPDRPITLVHRSDGSGTTAVFTTHLSAISPAWKTAVGSGLNVKWPAGIGVKDNSGVSAQILQAEGAIGYVEYSFAKQLKTPIAALENKAGKYIELTDQTTASALSTVTVPADLRVTVADPTGDNSYR
jgi:phosphate transport system substrate-binding protein